jgi:hypothetical protein
MFRRNVNKEKKNSGGGGTLSFVSRTLGGGALDFRIYFTALIPLCL